MRIVITGAAGRVGRLLRPHLRRSGRELRLLDLVPPADLDPGTESYHPGSVTDPAAVGAASEGADLVVHLGGLAGERPWTDILDTNINGTYTVLEAARQQHVPRVLLASSLHAVGMVPVAQAGGDEVLPPRPDTFYGVGKATLEALGSLYADAYGMAIVSARIGTVDATPIHERALATWLSPRDAARLVEATLALAEPGHHIVWGVSRNTRRWVSLAAGEAIGFKPEDDAERHAATLPTAEPPGVGRENVRLGGVWGGPDHEVGTTW